MINVMQAEVQTMASVETENARMLFDWKLRKLNAKIAGDERTEAVCDRMIEKIEGMANA